MSERARRGRPVNHAYGYMRVSTKRQVAGDSFRRQENAIRICAQNHGLKLVEIFREEAVSGAVPLAERPQGGELVRRLAKEKGHVIVESTDRIFRNVVDAMEQMDTWYRSGVVLHFADHEDPSSASYKFNESILAIIAEFEEHMQAEMKHRSAIT